MKPRHHRPTLASTATSLLLASLLTFAAAAAQAAPEAPAADPITSLLIEKGLLPAQAPAVMRSMRDAASGLVGSAMNFIGVRYRRGGNSAESGFDCSGFTRHVYENGVGLVLPRRADEQATSAGLAKVQRAELQPGDLVFFNTLKRTFSHVGIYVGENRFIHAPKPGGEVRVENMGSSYWARRFTGARRAAAVAEGAVGNAPAVVAQAATNPSPNAMPGVWTSSTASHAAAATPPLGFATP